LTLAFSRHNIGVVSEQKKCTEAKKEQKQKFEQKLHKNDRSSQAVVFYMRTFPMKMPDSRMVGHIHWWSWRVSHPRPNGNWLSVYKLSPVRGLTWLPNEESDERSGRHVFQWSFDRARWISMRSLPCWYDARLPSRCRKKHGGL